MKKRVIYILIFAVLLAIVVYLWKINRKVGPTTASVTPVPSLALLPGIKTATGKLVDGFPDFPMYPDAKIQTSQWNAAQQKPYYVPQSYQSFSLSDTDYKVILQWYKDNAAKSDWIVQKPQAGSTADDLNITLVKDTLIATVNVEQEEPTEIAIDIR